jgi:ABC-2 type transport system permease protein
VGDTIREGSFNTWLLQPMPPLYHPLASELAGKVVTMAFACPAAALLALVLRPELHTSPRQVALFILSLGLAWLLRFFWGYWLALLAFWASRSDALLAVQDSLVFLLGGQVAPASLLPTVLYAAALWLPFRYMLGFPVEVLMGKVGAGELGLGFGVQIAWLAAAAAFSALIWRAGLCHYTAVGG